MKKKNIIFIAGVHGVGKTTFAKKISRKYELKYYSSSELISIARSKKFNNKLTKHINDNQDLLLNSIEKLLDKNKTYFLDGHFCLLNKNLEVNKIPVDTYLNMGIKVIIVLTDSVENIYSRLKNRDGKEYDLDLINRFQNEELSYANQVSSILNIPIVYVDVSEYDIINSINIEKSLMEHLKVT